MDKRSHDPPHPNLPNHLVLRSDGLTDFQICLFHPSILQVIPFPLSYLSISYSRGLKVSSAAHKKKILFLLVAMEDNEQNLQALGHWLSQTFDPNLRKQGEKLTLKWHRKIRFTQFSSSSIPQPCLFYPSLSLSPFLHLSLSPPWTLSLNTPHLILLNHQPKDPWLKSSHNMDSLFFFSS